MLQKSMVDKVVQIITFGTMAARLLLEMWEEHWIYHIHS